MLKPSSDTLEAPAGLQTKLPEFFVIELLEYLQAIMLWESQHGNPEDLDYFGSACFETCMYQFGCQAAALMGPESMEKLVIQIKSNCGLSVYAKCAGLSRLHVLLELSTLVLPVCSAYFAW